jgi:phospholipid/cholesterol/gamma-HCH transport system substrate-binding protein
MKVKFNKFERVAGIFVLVAVLGFLISVGTIAVKQSWFESKVYFTTIFENADGVHSGTAVHMAGLKAGSVDNVELTADNKILVKFYVLEKFQNKIRKDSSAQLIRPFVIGERVVELTVGSIGSESVKPNTTVASKEVMDLMSILNGKNLGQSLEVFSSLLTNIKFLAESFLSKERTQSLVSSFDRIEPLLKNLNVMAVEMIKLSKQATKDENLGVVLHELATTTKDINQMIPEMKEKAPHLARDMASLVQNMAVISDSFKAFVPALAEIAPDLPKTSRRAVEALDEAVVLIKAMEKSFMVRGSVKEVREEEAERKPAHEK